MFSVEENIAKANPVVHEALCAECVAKKSLCISMHSKGEGTQHQNRKRRI